MSSTPRDEWDVILKLLPQGWEKAARDTGAFQRVRYTDSPSALLRLLLFHAVNDGGLRATVAQAEASGIASMSAPALHKRLRTSGAWLEWIAAELCRPFREQRRLPEGLRLRVIDGSTIQGPSSKGIDWRLHFMIDLPTLACDWHLLTDNSIGESLQIAPVREGDVILADRNFSKVKEVQSVVARGGHVLVRLRWAHGRMICDSGRRFKALSRSRRVRVGQVQEWAVTLQAARGDPAVRGRVVATRLPAPLARKAERRIRRIASRKGKRINPKSIQATRFVMIFTTLPKETLDEVGVMELYRYRWQVELAFKRLKQLLRLGRLPHKDKSAARTWIYSKLVVALLLEKLYRQALFFSPWGHSLQQEQAAPATA